MDVPKAQAVSNPTDANTGYVNLTWDKDPLATGYKVWVYNGKDYEAYDVKDTDHWSTQGKKIWPTATEISTGRYALHHDNLGTELAKDPSPVYQNSGGIYGSKTNYWFRVTSYTANDESTLSGPAMPTIPGQEASYLGTEDFWSSLPVVGGTVNAFSGNLVLSTTDFDLTGRGPGIEIKRTYNSQDTGTGLFGKGWYSNLEQKVAEQANGDVLFTDDDKTIHRFRKVTTNQYEAPLGVYLELTKDGNGYYLKDKDQSITSFDTTGKLTSEKDDNGNKITYQYTSGKLTSITDASGRIISFQYQTDGYISNVTYETRVVSYTYNTGNLTEVKTPENRIDKYGYENGKLRFVYDPKHTIDTPFVTEYVYTTDKLTAVKDVLLKQTTLSYNTALREVTVTNPKGTNDVYTYNEAGNPVKSVMDSASLKLTTTYQYENNNLINKTDPKDQGVRTSETYTFDGKGNVTQATDAVGTETYEYNANNDITKAVDTENDPTTIAYEDTNAVSETDVAGKTASVTNYDTYGNVTESSTELAPSRNYFSNPSFENGLDSNWIKNTLLDNGTMSVVDVTSPARGLSGGKVLRLDSSNATSTATQQGYVAATQELTVKPNTTYTLSGLVKAEGLDKAYILYNVKLMDAQNQALQWIANHHNKVTGTTKWLERQLSFTTTANTAKVKIYLEFEHRDSQAKGSALFDAIQLEEGPVSSSFNPVVNSGFEQSASTATGWTKSSTSTTNNGIATEGFSGSNGVYLQRNTTTDPNIQYDQDIVVNQTTPKDLTVTGMSKAENVVNSSGQSLNPDYSLWADVTFTDGTTGAYQAKFPTGTHDWNRSAVKIPASDAGKRIQKIKVSLMFRNGNTGKTYFDDIRVVEGNVLSKNEYDAKSNYVTAAYDELGNKAQYQYDLFGNKTSETDPKGNNKTYEWNAEDQLKKVTLPNNTSVSYGYDQNGNNTTKTITANGTSQIMGYEYDKDNKLISYLDPFRNRTTHSYDDNGNKIKTSVPNGHMIEWTYDTADRLKEEKRDGAVAFTYEYDANGNENKVTDSVNSIVRSKGYDSANRLQTMTERGGTISWSYQPNSSKLKDVTLSQAGVTNKTSYEYNKLDQNTAVTDDNGTPTNSGDDKKYYFDFDEQGNTRTYTAGNGSGSIFDYDLTGKITSLQIGNADNTMILSESYGYDKNGNRTSITHYLADGTENGKTLYDYDSINQLIKETRKDGTITDYTYDGVGNRKSVIVTEPGKSPTTTTANYNERNQLISYGSESITYDLNGNRLSDGQFTYTWNAADQLTAITKKGQSTPFATYKYDDDDRRIEKTINGITTRYYYDGDSINVLYETDGNGNVLRQYVYGANGVRLAMKTQGQTLYYHYNPHGDVIAITDQSGNVVAKYEYDAWGNVLSPTVTGIAADNPFGYAGYMYDKETSMYYLMARYYHPKHGVFISVDPDPGDEDDPITQNGYTYVSNNPVNTIDPTGKWNLPTKGEARILTSIYRGLGKSAKYLWNVSKKTIKKWKSPKGKSKGLSNPFKGKSFKEIENMFMKKGFTKRGGDPLNGKGGYVNPKTGRSYYLDKGGHYKKGYEPPHVDVNRLKNKNSNLSKKKYFLGD